MKFTLKYRRLFYRAFLVTVLVLCANQVFIQYWLNKKNEEGIIINIAGRQRMLSQRINLLILRAHSEKQSSELDSLILLWQKNHAALLGTRKSELHRAISNMEAEKLLKELVPQMDQAAHLMRQSRGDSSTIHKINKILDHYLVKMDRAVFALSEQADNRLTTIVIIELILFFISVLMLLIEMKFILIPVFQRLRKTIHDKDTLLKEKKSNILWVHTEYLKSLHSITTSTQPSEYKIQQILLLVQSYLELPLGIVSRIEGETYTVEFCTDNDLNIKGEDAYPLSNTICDITLNHPIPNEILSDTCLFYDRDIKNSTFSNHKAIRNSPLKTYIGVAIKVDGSLYGTLNFSAKEVREAYEEETILMFLQAKEAIAYQLQRIERRKLQEENEQLALIAKSTHNAVIITNRNSEILWVNEGFEKMTGYSSDESIGRIPGHILQGPDTDQKVVKAMKIAINEGRPYYGELINYHKDGTPYWVGRDLQPMFNEEGKVEKFMAIEYDITDRVNLSREKEQLAVVATKTNNSVIIFDLKDHIIWVNDGFLKLTGYSPEEAMETSLQSILLGPHTNPAHINQLNNAIANGQPLQIEIASTNKQGDPYWSAIDLQPIKNEEGHVERFVILQTDITEKVNARNNELLGELRGEEKERNRISRDLHDGVGQMLVASRLLLGQVTSETPMKSILQQKETIDNLLSEMISETRLIINNLEVSLDRSKNFREALSNLIEKSYRVFGGEINLAWEGKDNFEDFIYSINMFRIIQEGLNNSIKYSEASTIGISVINNGQLKVTIEDNGQGFDMDGYEELIGSGLQNIKARAENLNLQFRIESNLGKGTKILITN